MPILWNSSQINGTDVPNGISALGSDSPIMNTLDLDLDLDLDSDPDSGSNSSGEDINIEQQDLEDKPKIRSLEREQYIQAVVKSPQLPEVVDAPLIQSDMNGK